ncbi:hypothetical protein DICVIV_06617 [Dictyocaulus viviparus]|uniref:7TM GPCR serpentine receptor class x (Srx) domain-containing protein n=1 Tax=Dictyocaulus viviparus TaxID=29172 RepID=A0A0D8XY86_DICVI|nr:hypothetical protein DICVIV_06617 [Dictyocaulus viviparus]
MFNIETQQCEVMLKKNVLLSAVTLHRYRNPSDDSFEYRCAFDMMGIYFNSLLSGYLFIVGGNYCYSPAMIFVSGTVALGLWCGTCLNCLLLVTNRLMDLWNRRVMEMLFHGHRTYIILMVPIFYSLYFTFFTPPIIFNSDHMAWFFATFTPDSNIDMFYNYPHTCNNVFVVAITCLLYVVYSKVLLRHSKIDNGLTWAQKSVSEFQCRQTCQQL